jgi:hypothetical protein
MRLASQSTLRLDRLSNDPCSRALSEKARRDMVVMFIQGCLRRVGHLVIA